MPRRPCLARLPDGRGCPAYAAPGKSYCDEHQRDRPPSPSQLAARSGTYKRHRQRLLDQGPPWTCGICGQTITTADDLALDHITPVTQGGANEPSNYQPAHRRCNGRKGGGQRQQTVRVQHPSQQR